MIDTHTHLYLDHFKDDIDDVIHRAVAVGVEKFYLPSISSKHNKSMHDLKNKFPNRIFCMIGLHPCYVDQNFELEIEFVKKQIKEHDYKAIGEIGIDLFHEKKYFDQQVIAFEEQIKLSIDYDMPIVIHSRDSFDEIFEVLQQFKSNKLRGIFHCFTGNVEQANKIIDLNFHLGIGGVVTFKNGKISEFLIFSALISSFVFSVFVLELILLESLLVFLFLSVFEGFSSISLVKNKKIQVLVKFYVCLTQKFRCICS